MTGRTASIWPQNITPDWRGPVTMFVASAARNSLGCKEQSVFALSSHRASIEQGRACVPPESSVRTEQVHCRVSVLVATV